MDDTARRIRPFADEHLGETVLIYCDIFGREPWNEDWTPAEARARIDWVRAGPRARGWVATEHGAVVGFALGFERVATDGVTPAFFLVEMGVRWDRQCAGIGTELLRALEADGLRAGLDDVEIVTGPGKWPCYFYEKNGYEVRARAAHEVILGRALR